MSGADDPTDAADEDTDGSEPEGVVGREKTRTGRLSFRLPPFRLPEFFPPAFELRLPIPGRRPGHRVSARTALVACLAFDLFDAVLALLVGSQLVGGARTLGGLALAATVADGLGLAYSWEVVAVLFGYPELTAFPTLTVLLLVQARR